MKEIKKLNACLKSSYLFRRWVHFFCNTWRKSAFPTIWHIMCDSEFGLLVFELSLSHICFVWASLSKYFSAKNFKRVCIDRHWKSFRRLGRWRWQRWSRQQFERILEILSTGRDSKRKGHCRKEHPWRNYWRWTIFEFHFLFLFILFESC